MKREQKGKGILLLCRSAKDEISVMLIEKLKMLIEARILCIVAGFGRVKVFAYYGTIIHRDTPGYFTLRTEIPL